MDKARAYVNILIGPASFLVCVSEQRSIGISNGLCVEIRSIRNFYFVA